MSKNPRLIDLTGRRFGKWSVKYQSGNASRGGALWFCHCDCGTQRAVIGTDLRFGKSASCGCTIDKDRLGRRNLTHGDSGSRLHYVWKNMRSRCSNPNNHRYRYYGARGISVCEQWSNYRGFQQWALSNGYRDDLTIERVNVEGNYCPENCIWISRAMQATNKRNNLKADDGELWLHKARKRGIKDDVFRNRVFAGWTHEDAATIPHGMRRTPRQRDGSGKFI